jgi:hydroxybutyrate-dimer hydrolase
MSLDFLISSIRRTVHSDHDDLLSAGLGLAGLAGAPAPFADPAHPTPAELRRRAIQSTWKGLADLGPLGGYGNIYGAVPTVPGSEFSAFARLPHARQPHRVLCQIPEQFDKKTRCLVLAPASGSRGIYGAMALAGAWALPHGYAVAYTDKGAGSGYFDGADGTGVALDGTRALADGALLEFQPDSRPDNAGIAVKHAHSGDHPEADWGAHVLQAAHFGLAMLDEAFPAEAPFTPENTRIIAVGLSNGGGAVLQAAGLDEDGWLDGVIALAPNVHIPGSGRALYDYATEAALLMPSALCAERFSATPFARIGNPAPPARMGRPLVRAFARLCRLVGKAAPPAWRARGTSLHAHGLLEASDATAQAEEAAGRLNAAGWNDAVIESAAFLTVFDTWRAIAVTYSSAYLRRGFGAMPFGFSFETIDGKGAPAPATPAAQAAWWPDGTGIPPDAGIGLFGNDQAGADPTFAGTLALRGLWSGGDEQARALHTSVEQLSVRLPRKEFPIWVIHGAEDGLIPAAFTSDAYIGWLRAQGRTPRYWRIPHAQHFDAFLALPGFGERYVPLLPYGYAVLERMRAQILDGERLPDPPVPHPHPRGVGSLDRACLDLPIPRAR